MKAAKGKEGNRMYATGNSLKNKKGQPMANYRRTDLPDSLRQLADYAQQYLAPIRAYWEHDFGIYNMNGNAAEMISEKGVTKGGSYKDIEKGLAIEAKGSYQGTATDIGFRYFMRVMSE